MADTNKTTQRFFLDLEGLGALWTKIKSSFASKSETENALAGINEDIAGVERSLENVLNMVLAVSPKEVANYSAAIASASQVVPGIAIKVLNDETVDGNVKPAGIYLVENLNPVSLIYVGNSNSSVNTEELAAIIARIAELEAKVVKTVSVTDGTNSLGSYEVVNNTLYLIHDDVVDINSDSINALTHRAIAAKFKEMQDMITLIPRFTVAVVDELPASDISTSTVYLVKNSDPATNNMYSEWLYVESSPTEWVWEKLGEQVINTAGGVTMDQVTSAINESLKNYVTTENLNNAITVAKTEIKNEIKSEISDEYLTKEEAASMFATEDSILESLQSTDEGSLGSSISIPLSDIESLS